jgi:hypothetical protein
LRIDRQDHPVCDRAKTSPYCQRGLHFPLVLLGRFRSSQRRQQALEQDVKQALEAGGAAGPDSEELLHGPGNTPVWQIRRSL